MQARCEAHRSALGKVDPEERDLIRSLHVRKTGLAELFASLSRMKDDALEVSNLYQRLVREMGEVTLDYQAWWDAMAKKYGWPSQPGGAWRIDFETCAVYLDGH